MYKITATVTRPGGLPVEWTRFSKEKMTHLQCEKLLAKPKVAGQTYEDKVHVENLKCVKIDMRQLIAG